MSNQQSMQNVENKPLLYKNCLHWLVKILFINTVCISTKYA